MKLRMTAVAMALLSNVTLADTFRAEAGLFYGNTDSDLAASDVDTFSVAGTVYLKPVDDSKGPRLEAAFLDQASGVTASWSNPDSPLDEFTTVSGRFVNARGTIVEAGYSDFLDNDTYRVGLGTYLSDNRAVVLSYTTNDDTDVDTIAANYRAVTKLAGTASLAYGVNAGYVDSFDDGYSIGGDLTWYPVVNLGLGATASFADFNNTETRSFGLQASYFVTPLFYVQGFVSNTDYDGPDEDTYGVGASFRF